MGLLVANKGNGVCVSTTSPWAGTPEPIDICLVPPPATGTPTPFVNTANLDDTAQVAATVRINGKYVVTKVSVIPFSSGAPPAAIKGLGSPPPVNNKCTFASASATVFVEGHPVERHRDITIQNHGNCPGGVKLKDAFSLDGSGIILSPTMTPAQRDRVLSDLDKLYEQPVGRDLLNNIQSSYQATGHTATIQLTGGGNITTYASAAERLVGGAGTSSTVGYNPNKVTGRPPEVGLGHELIHSWHAQNALMQPGTMTAAASGGPQNIRELQAIGVGPFANDPITDNQLRNERGLPNRHGHSADPTVEDFPYEPDPQKKAKPAWATGSGGEKLVYAG